MCILNGFTDISLLEANNKIKAKTGLPLVSVTRNQGKSRGNLLMIRLNRLVIIIDNDMEKLKKQIQPLGYPF